VARLFFHHFSHLFSRLISRLAIPLTALFAGLLAPSAHAEPLTLVFAGDIMLDDGPGRLISTGGDPLAPFAPLLEAADYRIGNLECPVAESGSPLDNKIYSFRARPAALRVLNGRFDAVALANNHSGDYGQTAFVETMQHLDQAGIARFGGGRNLDEAHRPLWIEKKGLRIAVLAYNEFKPRAFEAGADWPGVAWSEDEHVVADIRAARAAGADLVIPFMHWGWEKEPRPSERQRQLARRMIDEGAALVVGGHPHVTQGSEIYKGKPIIYSLGNFVFDGFDYEAAQRGWLLRLQLDKQGVVFWETLAAQIDDQGTPHPVAGAATPCARGGADEPSLCLNPGLQTTEPGEPAAAIVAEENS
jgi:poly-gamma-glutamate synthesis protein (capsule biosynthesis protein)